MLADLRDRLARTRWPRAIPGQGWGYGVDISVVRDLCERWMEFDWRSQEAKLNEQPQKPGILRPQPCQLRLHHRRDLSHDDTLSASNHRPGILGEREWPQQTAGLATCAWQEGNALRGRSQF